MYHTLDNATTNFNSLKQNTIKYSFHVNSNEQKYLEYICINKQNKSWSNMKLKKKLIMIRSLDAMKRLWRVTIEWCVHVTFFRLSILFSTNCDINKKERKNNWKKSRNDSDRKRKFNFCFVFRFSFFNFFFSFVNYAVDQYHTRSLFTFLLIYFFLFFWYKLRCSIVSVIFCFVHFPRHIYLF